MNSESTLILENWEAVRDYIPQAKRVDVAVQWLKQFEEYGMDPGLFHDVVGEDKYLEEAFNALYGEDPEAEYEDDSDDDFDNSDD